MVEHNNKKEVNSKNTDNAIYFDFSYAALKLLGKNLYSNAANAISELVANGLDAKAKNVYVYIDMSDKEHSIIRVLLKVYEVLNGKDDTYNIIKNFIELLSDRNIFAHVREEKSEDGQYQFKRLNNGEYLVLSDEKCIELRTSIINYYKAISNIQ